MSIPADAPPLAAKRDPLFIARVLRATGIAAAVVLTVLLLHFGASAVLLIFTGILFAIVLHRVAASISKRTRLSQGWAVALVVVVGFAFVVGIGWLLGSEIATQAAELSRQLPKTAQQVLDRVTSSPSLRELFGIAPGTQTPRLGPLTLLSSATNIVVTAMDAAIAIVVLLFLAIYGALESEPHEKGLLSLVPLQKRQRAGEVLHEITTALYRWMVGRAIAMAAVGVLVWLGLWIMGVPLPLALGFVAGMLTFIPYIGAVISAVPAVLLALNQGPMGVVWVILLFTGAHLIEGYLLTPIITKQTVSFPAAFTLATQVLFGALYGVVGLALATPLAVVAVVLIQKLYVEDALGDAPA